jgi:hypothetical protein
MAVVDASRKRYVRRFGMSQNVLRHLVMSFAERRFSNSSMRQNPFSSLTELEQQQQLAFDVGVASRFPRAS